MKALIVIAALVLAGCSASADGPPEIALDRTACARCGMLVSDVRFAAAAGKQGAAPQVFDDIGCLRAAVLARPALRDATFWFHDAAHGDWIRGGDVTFVASAAIQTPMGGGYLAFRDPATAEREAAARQGRVIRSLDALLGDQEKDGGQ
jgi:nitrous oxide reductase accessory protein NosL